MPTPGQTAYEADVAAHPLYDDGQPRKAWYELGEVEQWSWERNPTPRWVELRNKANWISEVFKPLPEEEAKLLRDYGP